MTALRWSLRNGGVATVTLCAIAAIMLLLLPVLVPSFYVFVATRVLVLGLFATAYNVVFGYAGMPSLGHAAFLGLGGYVVGLGATRWEFGFVSALLLALLVGAIAGFVFGVFCLRVRGIYLLLLTLALGQALYGLAFNQVALTGGDNGIPNIPRVGVPSTSSGYYYLVLGVVGTSLLILRVFATSSVGRVIVGIRESESRMESMGYHVAPYRIAAFIVSGAFSAVAGALYAHLHGSVSTANFHWLLSADVMIFAILGGASYFVGPLVGTAAVLILEVYASTYTDRWTTLLGIIFIVVALFLRAGLLGLAGKIEAWRKQRQLESPPGRFARNSQADPLAAADPAKRVAATSSELEKPRDR